MGKGKDKEDKEEPETAGQKARAKCPKCSGTMKRAAKSFDRSGTKAKEVPVHVCHNCKKAFKGEENVEMPKIYEALATNDMPTLNVADVIPPEDDEE